MATSVASGAVERITSTLRREIRNGGQPGLMLPSDREMTRRFGVSVPTLRQAMAVLASEGLVDRRKGRRTAISQTLPGAQRPATVGIVCECDIGHASTSFFYPRVVQDLRQFFAGVGYGTRLFLGHGNSDSDTSPPEQWIIHEAAAAARRNELAGLVVVTGVCSDERWSRPLADLPIPVSGLTPVDCAHQVDFDHEAMIRAGLDLVLDSGRKSVGLLCWGAERHVDAFLQHTATIGLATRPHWVRVASNDQPLTGRAYREVLNLWRTSAERPDALLVLDDMLFRDAASALLELRLSVPRDLLVVAHANRGSGIHYPFRVWCLEVDPSEVARRLGEALVPALKGQAGGPNRSVVPFRIVANGHETAHSSEAAPGLLTSPPLETASCAPGSQLATWFGPPSAM